MKEREITICGKQVKMIYCTATENAFEEITEKSISVFVPKFGKDDEGKDIITKPAEAKIGDYVSLAIAGIVAAYAKDKKDTPISTEYVLYNCPPTERNDMIVAIAELRNEWYSIPKVVADTVKAENEQAGQGEGDEDTPKN